MAKAFMCSLCHNGVLGGGLYLDAESVIFKTQKLFKFSARFLVYNIDCSVSIYCCFQILIFKNIFFQNLRFCCRLICPF